MPPARTWSLGVPAGADAVVGCAQPYANAAAARSEHRLRTLILHPFGIGFTSESQVDERASRVDAPAGQRSNSGGAPSTPEISHHARYFAAPDGLQRARIALQTPESRPPVGRHAAVG